MWIHFVCSGHIYTRCYIAIVMSYGDLAYHYGDMPMSGTNCDIDATVQ